jgi:phosphate transport system substrate-binding protein
MIKKEKQVRKGTILLISLAMVFLFLTTSILFGCKTNTVAETTAADTTAAETVAIETTATSAETTAETTSAETTAAVSETTAAETTATETTATETTAANKIKFTNEKLIISGSTTLLEVAQLWAEAFMEKFGGEVTINGGGSGVGIADLINGTADLCNSSRAIKASEKTKATAAGKDIKEYKVLIDGICIVTSKNINIPELTLNQLSDIYIGNYTNWKQVGGPDAPILAIARDSSSGTGEFFLQKVVQLGQTNTNDYSPNDLRLQSNADVVNQVESSNNAIGYIGMGYLQDAGNKVNLVKVKFDANSPAIAPNVQTVSNFTYSISRYCYIYADGKKISKIAQAYLDFVISAEGQNIVAQAGFVKVK